MMIMLLRGVRITINVPEEIIKVTLFYKELILLGSPASLTLFMREANIWLRLCKICLGLLVDRRVGRARVRTFKILFK